MRYPLKKPGYQQDMKKKVKWYNEIGYRFAMLTAMTTIVVFLIHNYLSQVYVENTITNNNQIQLESTAYQLTERVNDRLYLIETMIKRISHSSVILSGMTDLVDDPQDSMLVKIMINREVLRAIDHNLVRNVYIVPKAGSVINCFYSEALFDIPGEYQDLLDNENKPLLNTIWWEVLSSDPYRLEAVTYLQTNNEISGLLVMSFDESLFDAIHIQNGIADTAEYMVTDSSNKIIFSSIGQAVGKSAFSYYSRESNDLEVNYDLPYAHWKLLGYYLHDSIDDEISSSGKLFVIADIIIILLMSTTSIGLFSVVLRPIDSLLSGMRQVQKGNLDTYIENNSKTEIGVIISSFNDMVRKLKMMKRSEAEQQRSFRRAELAALKAKLNPHFLYNTLDMIHWMLVLEDQNKTADVVVTLSDILRYSIDHDDEYVTIEEDFKQLENYLTIQHLRFGSKLEYQIVLDPNVEFCKIPKLLIQPIIENAIKYAFVEMRDTGYLNISCREDGAFIRFTVTDNGQGIPEETLNRLNQNSGIRSNRPSLGIELVRSSVFSTYGEDCGINIESKLGEGTCVTVMIRKVMISYDGSENVI